MLNIYCIRLKQQVFQVIKQEQVTYLPYGVKIKLGWDQGLAIVGGELELKNITSRKAAKVSIYFLAYLRENLIRRLSGKSKLP